MKMKSRNKTGYILTALLIGVVSGGVVIRLLSRFSYSKYISEFEDLVTELKDKVRKQEVALNNRLELSKDALRDKELMEKIVTDIKEKINS